MTDLFLVAHKVRGEPAFDIAEKMECPLCNGKGCFECDDCGYWWIVPTSGHRAYPYYWRGLEIADLDYVNAMPPDLPDHYAHYSSPHPDRLAALLASLPPAQVKPFKRRF